MSNNTEKLQQDVMGLVAEFTGCEVSEISPETDLVQDLGIAGDDGVALFTELDKAYNVDWDGLEPGIHFGNEGLGLPLPWQMKGNCVLYQSQPCRIADIVTSIEQGKWIGTPKILKSKSNMFLLYAGSCAFFLILCGGLFWLAYILLR